MIRTNGNNQNNSQPNTSISNILTSNQIASLSHQAANGDAQAQFSLAELYKNGTNGFAIDFPQAIELYAKAALNNHENAKNSLILMYMKGEGVTKNIQLAERLSNGDLSFLTNLTHVPTQQNSVQILKMEQDDDDLSSISTDESGYYTPNNMDDSDNESENQSPAPYKNPVAPINSNPLPMYSISEKYQDTDDNSNLTKSAYTNVVGTSSLIERNNNSITTDKSIEFAKIPYEEILTLIKFIHLPKDKEAEIQLKQDVEYFPNIPYISSISINAYNKNIRELIKHLNHNAYGDILSIEFKTLHLNVKQEYSFQGQAGIFTDMMEGFFININNFIMQGINLKDDFVKIILECILKNALPSLTTIELRNCPQIQPISVTYLCDCIYKDALVHLEKIVFAQCPGLNIENLRQLAICIKRQKLNNLEILDLSNNPHLTDEDIAYLIPALSHAKNLQIINLNNCNKITDKSLNLISDEMEKQTFPKIRQILLHNTQISDIGFTRFLVTASMKNYAPYWQIMDIGGTNISDESISYMCNIAKQDKTIGSLTELYLNDCSNLTSFSFRIIADTLISEAVVLPLFKLDISNLKSVDCSNNQPLIKLFNVFADGFAPNLENIILDVKYLTHELLNSVLNAIKSDQMPEIKYIDFMGCTNQNTIDSINNEILKIEKRKKYHKKYVNLNLNTKNINNRTSDIAYIKANIIDISVKFIHFTDKILKIWIKGIEHMIHLNIHEDLPNNLSVKSKAKFSEKVYVARGFKKYGRLQELKYQQILCYDKDNIAYVEFIKFLDQQFMQETNLYARN